MVEWYGMGWLNGMVWDGGMVWYGMVESVLNVPGKIKKKSTILHFEECTQAVDALPPYEGRIWITL